MAICRKSLLGFIDAEPAADKNRIACLGYCMSGPFAVTAAARFPGRFKAAASLYGVGLVTDAPDSPHKALRPIEAELYFAFAEKDQAAPITQVEPLRQALDAAGAKYEIEVFPGVDHGFGFPQRRAFDKPSAERLWERLFDLFGRAVPPR